MRRLNGVDALLLYTEAPEIHMHTLKIGILDVSQLDGEFTYELFRRVAEPRLRALTPLRYQLVDVPMRFHHPMWTENADVDFDYHVRRVSVPAPGGRRELDQLIGEIAGTPLDRSRPLWEMYVAEGLVGNRIAIIHKVHHVLADGVASANQMGWAIQAEPPEFPAKAIHTEERERTTSGLMLAASRDHARQIRRLPMLLAETARGVSRVRRRAKERGRHPQLAPNFAPPPSFLNHVVSPTRRFATAPLALADVKEAAKTLGVTVNDVVLATVAGGLREWLMTRDESLGGIRKVRAVAPVSVIDEELEATSLGSQIAPHWVDLPVGEPNAVVRLHQVSYSFQAHRETGRGVAANRLAGIAGFAPATFHAIGARVAVEELRRGFQLTVTNVPGPQSTLHASGARMLETYPVHPLLPGHALAIGVTSYDGQVFYGITADRDLLPDVELLGACLTEALDELLDTASGARPKVPRGRKKAPQKSANE